MTPAVTPVVPAFLKAAAEGGSDRLRDRVRAGWTASRALESLLGEALHSITFFSTVSTMPRTESPGAS